MSDALHTRISGSGLGSHVWLAFLMEADRLADARHARLKCQAECVLHAARACTGTSSFNALPRAPRSDWTPLQGGSPGTEHGVLAHRRSPAAYAGSCQAR